jgi:hypothetical protein
MTYSTESVARKRAAVRTLLILCAASMTASCSSTPSFSGTYLGNEAASVMPPGQKVPPNFRLVIEDDGVAIKTIQTFTVDSREAVRLVWEGECDGKERPVVGAAPPGMHLSCRRSASGALVNTISGADWSYVETCVLESKVRMTCKGSMLDEKGQPLPFSYAFDRQE